MNKKRIPLILIAIIFFSTISYAQTSSIISIGDFTLDKGNVTIAPIEIEVNDATGLGSATIVLSYDPDIIRVLQVTNGKFDSMIPHIDNEIGSVRFVTYQTGTSGVGPGLIKYAEVEFEAIGEAGSESPLTLDVLTLRNNTGSLIPFLREDGNLKINNIIEGNNFVGSGNIIYENSEHLKPSPENTINETIDEKITGYADKQIVISDEDDNNNPNSGSFKIPGFNGMFSVFILILTNLYINRK